MSDVRKRKLQAALAHASELPEALQFVPSIKAPANETNTKKQKLSDEVAAAKKDYDSGLFNLQAKEFFKLRRPKEGESGGLLKLVKNIEKQLRGIAESRAIKLSDAQSISRESDVQIPFASEPPSDLQLNLQYLEPSEITHLTSPSISSLEEAEETNLYVEAPPELLQEKDHLNNRVVYKLAFYQFIIAKSLKDKYSLYYERRIIFGIERIVLVVKQNERQVVIHLVVPQSSLDEIKLEPEKNADRSCAGPTPLYNTSILLLIHETSLIDRIRQASEQAPGFTDSVILAHGYLSKRSLPIKRDQWALVTALLLEGGGKNGGKLLSPNASALQIFRGVVLFLSQFFSNSHSSVAFGGSQQSPGCWVKGLNIFATVTEQQRQLLSRELSNTNLLLRDEHRTPLRSFEKIFLSSQNLIGSWDLEITIEKYIVDDNELERIWRTLDRALGGRATLIRVAHKFKQIRRSVSESMSMPTSDTVSISLMLDQTLCQSKMILGPPANTSEAKSFQRLWGDLAELHRFKDGKILEAVELMTPNATLDACHKILRKHFSSIPSSEKWIIYGADRIQERSLAEKSKALALEFYEFARVARDLENLPLRIENISSSHPVFYQTSHRQPQYLDAVLRFESSARWPDDLEAIQRTKIAFLLAARGPFESLPTVKGVQVRLESRSSMTSLLNSGLTKNLAFLHVEMTSGSVYRLRVQCDRELVLLEANLKNPSIKKDSRKKPQYEDAQKLYNSTYIDGEIHSQVMQALRSRFPTLPESTILLKEWFDSHLLCGHFSDQVIDLIALNIYINDAERKTNSPMAGFAQTLTYLAEWDWRQDPLILSEDLQTHKQQSAAFDQLKAQNPGHSMIIHPPYKLPPPEVNKLAALRMSALAKAASATLQTGGDITSTMVTPLGHFDCILTLSKSKETKYKNLQSDNSAVELSKLFLQDMEEIHGDALHLFPAYDMSKIGVLVDPALHQARRFRPNLGYPTRPASDHEGQMVVIDTDVLFDEIQHLGAGIIKSIQRKR